MVSFEVKKIQRFFEVHTFCQTQIFKFFLLDEFLQSLEYAHE